MPPAMATPSTAAMTGFVGRYVFSSPRYTKPGSSFRRACSSMAPSGSTSPAIARRSMPEEKFPSAPVRMAQRRSSFSLSSCQASAMRANIVSVIAFLRFGRFIVTTIT